MRKLMMRVVLALISIALVCPLIGTAGAQGPPEAFGQRWTQPQGGGPAGHPTAGRYVCVRSCVFRPGGQRRT